MILEQMEIRLEKWKRIVWVCLGASAAELLSSAADSIFNPRRVGIDQYYSWIFAWIIVQSAAVAPAILLAAKREWRQVPLPLRFQTVFGSLFASWLALCSFGLHVRFMIDSPAEDIPFFLLIIGLVLGWIYVRLRKQLVTAPESMFP
jgi:hypothetical protein